MYHKGDDSDSNMKIGSKSNASPQRPGWNEGVI